MATCLFKRTHPNAVIPTKSKKHSRGYDLTLVDIKNRVGSVVFYNTGLILEPPPGWVYNLYPRSGITKTGHILVNSTGIIESDYRGELICALWKFDPSMPDLELPCRLMQLVFVEETPEFEFEENHAIDLNTDRGSDGFGSSGFR